MATGPELRIGHAEREAAAASLREHYAQGRLTLEEFNERLDATFKAVTQGQLNQITEDLPHAVPPSAALPVTTVPGGGRDRARQDWSQGHRHHPRLGIFPVVIAALGTWMLLVRVAPEGVPLAGQAGDLPRDLRRHPRRAAARVRPGPGRRRSRRPWPWRPWRPVERHLIGALAPSSAGNIRVAIADDHCPRDGERRRPAYRRYARAGILSGTTR